MSEIDAVSEFSKHFKRVMKEREKEEEETKKEPISVTPVKEEEKEEEMEEEKEEEEENAIGLHACTSALSHTKEVRSLLWQLVMSP